MKVLLWKIGAIGDVLMTTPLVRQLRRLLPHAQIDYLVGGSSAVVVEGNPHLDSVATFDEAILYRRQPFRLRELASKLEGYDAVYVLDKHWIFALLARMSGSPERIGFRRRARDAIGLTRRAPYGELRHEIHCYLDLAEANGLQVDRRDLALEFSNEAPCPIAQGTTVLVNSGGANGYEHSQVRRMPDSVFAELVRACSQAAPVAFLGAASEAAYYERFASDRCLNLCGRTSVREAAGVLRHAARVITTDTGLMHLAAAVNRDVTAVFGPTHPQRKCPPGARWVWTDAALYDPAYEVFGRVPHARFFASLRVDDVLGATQVMPHG